MIVLIETHAAPRHRAVDGLWRKPVKGRGTADARSGAMTALIRAERLLPRAEIDAIIVTASTKLLNFQRAASLVALGDREPMLSWIERFHRASEFRAA